MNTNATANPDWLKPKTLMGISVVVALITIALKTLAWWFTDSVGLLSDALESVVNLASAMFGLAMVSWAEQPPDDAHPYATTRPNTFPLALKASSLWRRRWASSGRRRTAGSTPRPWTMWAGVWP